MIVCENLLSSSVHLGQRVFWKNGKNHLYFSGTHKFGQIFICDSFL